MKKLFEWVEGAPACDEYALMHIPLKNYPDYKIYGCIAEDGGVVDFCGDCQGYDVGDVERHMFVTEPE